MSGGEWRNRPIRHTFYDRAYTCFFMSFAPPSYQEGMAHPILRINEISAVTDRAYS